jgi:oligopeptide transport system substrate-binding protein
MKLRTLLAIVLIAVLFVSLSCQERRQGPGAASFSFINRGDIITLDINQMSYLQDFRITYALREGLFTYDPSKNFSPVPALATSWTQSDDKRVWTFRLRTDAKWSNGDPVVAGDFVFSWRHLLESPGEYTYLLYYIRNAKAYEDAYREQSGMSFAEVGVAAPDDHTLVVTLNDPVPFLPDLLAFPPFYPRHAASMEKFKQTDAKGRVSYSAEYTRPGNVVTNGPFELVQWEPGRTLVMKRSETYWNKSAVRLERIEMVVNNDPQSAFVQYDQGRVDWLADVSAEIAFQLKQQNRPDLRVGPAFGTAFLTVNCAEKVGELRDNKNPLSDVRVRQALSMAIDRDYIVNSITRMGERPANAYVPPGFFDGWTSTPAPTLNIEEAKKLLAEAGYPGGQGMPTISIAYNSESPTRKELAEYLSFQWKQKLGVPCELRPLELKTYREYITTKQYTLGLAAWYGDYMDPSTFTDKYLSTSLNNDSNWGPRAYDELLLQASKEPDEKKRLGLLMQAEAMINTELPVIPLYYYVNVTLHRDNVKGLLTNPKNLIVWKDVFVER